MCNKVCRTCNEYKSFLGSIMMKCDVKRRDKNFILKRDIPKKVSFVPGQFLKQKQLLIYISLSRFQCHQFLTYVSILCDVVCSRHIKADCPFPTCYTTWLSATVPITQFLMLQGILGCNWYKMM